MSMYIVNLTNDTVIKLVSREAEKYLAENVNQHCCVFDSASEAVQYINSWLRYFLDGNKSEEYKTKRVKSLANMIAKTYEL